MLVEKLECPLLCQPGRILHLRKGNFVHQERLIFIGYDLHAKYWNRLHLQHKTS